MTDIIVVAILILVVGSALGYIIHEKKRGVKCVGCPYAESCRTCRQDEHASCGGEAHECGCHAKQE